MVFEDFFGHVSQRSILNFFYCYCVQFQAELAAFISAVQRRVRLEYEKKLHVTGQSLHDFKPFWETAQIVFKNKLTKKAHCLDFVNFIFTASDLFLTHPVPRRSGLCIWHELCCIFAHVTTLTWKLMASSKAKRTKTRKRQ